MAKIEMRGLDAYAKAISSFELRVRDDVCGKAIYTGAAIVADTIRAAIANLPEGKGHGTEIAPLPGPNAYQKEGLIRSFGLTPMRDDNGMLNVKAGFDGYNTLKSKRWPKGQPNAMVARSVERGTSFMRENLFIKDAVSKARKSAMEAMKKSVDESSKELMK